MLDRVKKIRRDLHKIPELELMLPKTQAYIEDILRDLPCSIEHPIEYSVVAFFDNHKEKTIAYRSDMDALPVCEQTNVDFKSEHEGCMHACGHDGHMAILLGFALELSKYYTELDHNVLLIFQPGEETPGGARLICETGLLQKYNVVAIFGTHLWPNLDKGVVATKENGMMARSSEVNIDIYGKSSHAAKYYEGIDALEIAARYIVDLYAMEKQLDPHIDRLLRVGKFDSGTVRNVVSDHARLEATLRSTNEDMYWHLRDQLVKISKNYPEARFMFDINEGYPAVFNDAKLVKKVMLEIPDIYELPSHEMISEDFSWYQQEVPGVFFFLGTGTGIPLHNDHFDFDEEVLLSGINTYIAISKLKF